MVIYTHMHLKRRLCLAVKVWFLNVQSLSVCEICRTHWDILEDKIIYIKYTCYIHVGVGEERTLYS